MGWNGVGLNGVRKSGVKWGRSLGLGEVEWG